MSKTFDVILITDSAVHPHWARGYGAHRIASHLRQHGFTVLVIDFSSALTFDIWKQICDLAIGENTQLVGFSTTWWPYRNIHSTNSFGDWVYIDSPYHDAYTNSLTYDAATGKAKPWVDYIKLKNKKTKVVVGGPKIDWYLDFPADYFVSGIAENEIIDLLTQPRRIWPKVIAHDTLANLKDWGWTSSSTFYTEYDHIQPGEILNLELARGCKFKCSFCSYPLIGQKDAASYLKTEETIYNELLRNYQEWGVSRYIIADDTFNDSVEKLQMFARVRSRLPFNLKIWSFIRLDIIATQPEQLQLLLDCGLTSCFIGLETFHPVAGKAIGKGMSEERKKETFYKIQQVWGDRVSVTAGYMIGLPGEDIEFLERQAKWFSEENNPINLWIWFVALTINPKGSLKYHFSSEIDRDPEKFGYTIPDMSRPNYWIKTRDDGTGILDYNTANEIADRLGTMVSGARGSRVDNLLTYDGSIKDPLNQYFLPLIEKLKKG